MKDNTDNDQLINEIQGLTRARSRHVVEIYDVIRDENGAVVGIIIELLQGRDYQGFHKEAASDITGYLRILYQIGTALSDLHSSGVVHRDLKLENLKDSASGILKLFDFGISVAAPDYITKTNRGTQVYAAPELYVPGAAITPEMDVYALGVCAWALATDLWPPVLLERPPQSSARAPSINTVLPKLLPSEIVLLIDSCLHPNAGMRPKAAMFSTALKRHLVRGQHRGTFVQGDTAVFELSQAKANVRIKIGTLGVLRVSYDDLVFRIDEVEGSVYVNNAAAAVAMELPEACVLTFGAPTLGAARQWVTFFSSHPEVVL